MVVKGDPNQIDPANEGKLVHVSGDLKTTARLTDPDFAMSAEAALFVRDAEMYQWKEENGETHWVWSAELVGPQPNPPFRFPTIKVTARDATLGAFQPGKQVLEKLPTIDLPIDSATVEAARTHVGGTVQVSNRKLYLGNNPAQPQMGDIRISWRIAKPGPVSLIGRQAGTDLVEFQTSGDPLLLARSGSFSAVEMFKITEQESSSRTWTSRMLCGCFMLVGWLLVLWRLVPALLLSGLIGVATIAGAWLEYRPFEAAIALTVVGIAATIAVISLARLRPSDAVGLSDRETADQTRAGGISLPGQNTRPHVRRLGAGRWGAAPHSWISSRSSSRPCRNDSRREARGTVLARADGMLFAAMHGSGFWHFSDLG